MNDNSSKVMDVDINEILPNRFQPRIQFDEDEILELSDSIKEHGVIQPIVVRTIGDKYEIIAGERRYKASVLAGRDTVPVIVKNLNDKDSAEIALIENIQRKNLTPIEEALSYKKILDMGYITQENLASKLGKSQPSIANKIRLLNLSDEVQEALLENKISERHARSLLRLKTSDLQNQMLERIISERLTVRRTDEEIDKLKYSDNDDNDDSQKRIEEGKINMNNNINMMPNMTSNPEPAPSFDMFGFQSQPQQPVEPQFVAPTPAPQSSFDMFKAPSSNTNMNNNLQFGTPAYEQPVQPSMGQTQFGTPGIINPEPTPFAQPAQEMPITNNGAKFDFNIPPIQVNDIPSMPQINQSQPVNNSVQFDSNGMLIQEPVNPIPVQPQDSFSVPVTSPIVENPIQNNQTDMNQVSSISDNAFAFGTPNDINLNNEPMSDLNTISNENEKMPEPIIVTDYNKQYDPIMPQTQNTMITKADFKEVINAIRECSAKIEQYGYKIDVEEFDLNSLYQVIFKIEK